MDQEQTSCSNSMSSNNQWLVIQNLKARDDDDGGQIFCSVHHLRYHHHHCRIPELLGRRIRACCHGWVILSKHPNNIKWCLWNPITSKLITLPLLINKEGVIDNINACYLSSPPNHSGSILLLTRYRKQSFVFCRLDRKRKRLKWTEMSYAKQLRSATGHDGSICYLTSCNDKIYAWANCGFPNTYVVGVDIVVKDKEVVISLMPSLKCPAPRYLFRTMLHYFLEGSCSELFLMVVSSKMVSIESIAGVHLFKLNMSRMVWEEMNDLCDSVLFVDFVHKQSVFWRSAIGSELGGYIHIRGRSGKVIHSYHVKDKTISPSSLPGLVQTSNILMIEMSRFSLEGDHGEGKSCNPEMVVKAVEGNDTMNDSRLLSIPSHVLEMIMELCVGVEYMKFRETCKQCHLSAPPIHWRGKEALPRLQNYQLVSPWLMVFDLARSIITFTDPVFGDTYFMRTSPLSIYEDVIYCSRYGWLLFATDMEQPVFFNPFTNDIRKLPSAPIAFQSSCFSAPPTSQNCVVVGFIAAIQGFVLILCVGRDTHWRPYHLKVPLDRYFRFPAFYGQDLYVLCKTGKVDVFKKLEEEDFTRETVVDNFPITCSTAGSQVFLVKSSEHILLVIVGEIGELVEVFKMNGSTEEWEKIDGLGRNMIYICGHTCLCMEAKIPEMENKIYFPRRRSEDGKIIFYSLETCRYHTFDGRNVQGSFEDFSGSKLDHHPHAWIELSWS